jgi:hypothetical protein
MTVLGATTLHIMTDEQIEMMLAKHKAILIEELSKKKVVESPMTKSATAKFLKCSEGTVTRRFNHLRHVVEDGTIYWYASEIESYIKKQ